MLCGIFLEIFQSNMHKCVRILVSAIEKYKNDVYFLVDTDNTYFEDVKSRVAWLKPLPCEINIDEVNAKIIAFLAKEVDTKAEPFGNYEVAKEKIIVEPEL